MLRLDANLIFTVINLLILFLVMRKLLIGPVMNVVKKRQEMIDEQFKTADDTRKQADELKTQMESELAEAGAKSDEILEKARKDAKREYDRIVKNAGAEADRIVSDAKKTAEFEKRTFMDSAHSEIASLAMSAAEKIIGSKDIDAVTSSMYDDFLSEAGENNETEGD